MVDDSDSDSEQTAPKKRTMRDNDTSPTGSVLQQSDQDEEPDNQSSTAPVRERGKPPSTSMATGGRRNGGNKSDDEEEDDERADVQQIEKRGKKGGKKELTEEEKKKKKLAEEEKKKLAEEKKKKALDDLLAQLHEHGPNGFFQKLIHKEKTPKAEELLIGTDEKNQYRYVGFYLMCHLLAIHRFPRRVIGFLDLSDESKMSAEKRRSAMCQTHDVLFRINTMFGGYLPNEHNIPLSTTPLSVDMVTGLPLPTYEEKDPSQSKIPAYFKRIDKNALSFTSTQKPSSEEDVNEQPSTSEQPTEEENNAQPSDGYCHITSSQDSRKDVISIEATCENFDGLRAKVFAIVKSKCSEKRDVNGLADELFDMVLMKPSDSSEAGISGKVQCPSSPDGMDADTVKEKMVKVLIVFEGLKIHFFNVKCHKCVKSMTSGESPPQIITGLGFLIASTQLWRTHYSWKSDRVFNSSKASLSQIQISTHDEHPDVLPVKKPYKSGRKGKEDNRKVQYVDSRRRPTLVELMDLKSEVFLKTGIVELEHILNYAVHKNEKQTKEIIELVKAREERKKKKKAAKGKQNGEVEDSELEESEVEDGEVKPKEKKYLPRTLKPLEESLAAADDQQISSRIQATQVEDEAVTQETKKINETKNDASKVSCDNEEEHQCTVATKTTEETADTRENQRGNQETNKKIPLVEPKQEDMHADIKEIPIDEIPVELEPKQEVLDAEIKEEPIEYIEREDFLPQKYNGPIDYDDLDRQENLYPGYPQNSKPKTFIRAQKRQHNSTMNHDIYNTTGAQVFHDFVFKVLDDKRYVFLKLAATDAEVHRMIFINLENELTLYYASPTRDLLTRFNYSGEPIKNIHELIT
ncbi:hypothetical protein B9Z55_004858 [Caenorhabditis nigoni]|uniref:Uncharacterized protein n=1 Tax=Caenorhabditis nigoni TaxID=1611254 RepID=A0A2G5UYB5_9PELO|nr:hypothetical protein B9Z55_004858 [Caenorhabditis nigoni]